MSTSKTKLIRSNLGNYTGYIVHILPCIRFDKVFYILKIFVQKLGIVKANFEEMQDWIWFGKAVNVSVIKKQIDDKIEILADDVSPNENIQSIEPESINILSFDEDWQILSIEKSTGRKIFMKISEQYLKEALEKIKEKECYALFMNKEGEINLIYVIDIKEYNILARAKELTKIIIDDYRLIDYEFY